jgi:hypothetical protein
MQINYYRPEQKNPFPVKPDLQAHRYDPNVLVQVAWTLQGLAKHSFISTMRKTEIPPYWYRTILSTIKNIEVELHIAQIYIANSFKNAK